MISSWVDDFSGMSLSGNTSWVGEFQSGERNMQGSETGVSSSTSSVQRSAQELNLALIESMKHDSDPKFRNSKFLQFVSKMSRGELIIEGNKVSSCLLAP